MKLHAEFGESVEVARAVATEMMVVAYHKYRGLNISNNVILDEILRRCVRKLFREVYNDKIINVGPS